MNIIEGFQDIINKRSQLILKAFGVKGTEHINHKYLRKENGKYIYEEREEKQKLIKENLVKTQELIKKYNNLIESYIQLELQAPMEYRNKLNNLRLQEKEYLENLKN
jgi:hypothetical protein